MRVPVDVARYYWVSVVTVASAWLPRGHTPLFADIVLALDRIVAGKRMHDVPSGIGVAQLDGKRSVLWAVARPRCQHLTGRYFTAERLRNFLERRLAQRRTFMLHANAF